MSKEKQLTDRDIQILIDHLEKSVNHSDLDAIVMINDTLSLLISEGRFSKEFVSENKDGIEKLCTLIEDCKAHISALKNEMRDVQKDFSKKKKISKKYTDVGRL